jgi:hypothetical protein
MINNVHRGNSFGGAADQPLKDADLTGIRHKLAKASREARDLEIAVERWREGTVFTSTLQRVGDSTSRLDIVVEMSRTFPHDRWATMLGEIGHQTRSGLDNLNSLLASRLAPGQFNPKRIAFPITTDEGNWKSWLGKHKMLPDWLTNRYYEIQPFVNNYHGLRGLHWFNNKDKHEWLRDIRVALVGMLGGGDFTVEGLIADEELQPVLLPRDNTLERASRRAIVGSIEFGHSVLDATNAHQNEVNVDILFDMGYAEYKLPEISELVRRVGYAVDFVAMDDRSALQRYRERPSFIGPDESGAPAVVS